jgi:hypothetical protein
MERLKRSTPAQIIHTLGGAGPDTEPFVVNAIRESGLGMKISTSLAELDAALKGSSRNGRSAILVPIWIPGGNYRLPIDGWKDAAALAIRHRVPSSSLDSRFVHAGGLLSYALDYHGNTSERMATLIDQLFRGANPATIPFELPTVSHFAVNSLTAQAIGVSLPGDWLLSADEIVRS